MSRKRIIWIAGLMIQMVHIYCQAQSAKYNSLISKADKYYRLKNYKTSALTYSQAFKANKSIGLDDDRFNAACSWALAEMPDSAFFQLSQIAKNGKYANLELLNTDHDLDALHKDKRWKRLLTIVEENKNQKEAKFNKPLIAQLETIYENDQTLRLKVDDVERKYGTQSDEAQQLWRQMAFNDSVDLTKVETILDKYGWLGPDVIGSQGNTTLFLVIQHSDLKTQEKYLPVLREAVKRGDANPSAQALLEDRVALRQGKKQCYGSQIIKDLKTGRDTVAPIEDYAHVDQRRASVGLEPLTDYVAHWGIVLKPRPKSKLVSATKLNNDFATALEIKDSIVGPVNVCRGSGSQIDFHWGPLPEENSAWYKFTINHDAVLTFDIVPVNPKDDYDFILFKCPAADCNEGIRTGDVTPDRRCYSQNFGKNGATGLSEYATEASVGPGPGSGYASGLPVKAGETYYLAVDFWGPSSHPFASGFTIYFYNYAPKKFKEQLKKELLWKSHPASPAVVQENVFFENDKAILSKESSATLDKLAAQLESSKALKIEIRGYTDNTGDEVKNQKLSEDRAGAIVNYLISKKIDKNRLSSVGFGIKQPLGDNNTEEGRKKNRRVEFVITSQ